MSSLSKPCTRRRQLRSHTTHTSHARLVEADGGGYGDSKGDLLAPQPSISASGGDRDAGKSSEPLHSLRPAPSSHLKLPVLRSCLLSTLARRDRVVDIEELHAQLNVDYTASSSPSWALPTCAIDYLRSVTVLVAYRTYFFPGLGVQWVLYLHWLLGQADAPISTDQLKDIDVRARTHMCQNPWDYHDAASLTDAVQGSRPLSAATEPHRSDTLLPDSEDKPPEMDGPYDVSLKLELLVGVKEKEAQRTNPAASSIQDDSRMPCNQSNYEDLRGDRLDRRTKSRHSHIPRDSKKKCQHSTDLPASMSHHRPTHAAGKTFSCEHCGKTFKWRISLTRHIMSHTGQKPHTCDVCGSAFSRFDYLTKHKRIHVGEKVRKCKHCGVEFSRRLEYIWHIQNDHGTKMRLVRLVKRSALTERPTVHTGERRFGCSVCQARFSKRSIFDEHMRRHTGERPYGCPSCPARFVRPTDMAIHMRTHTGERYFGCRFCEARFRYRETMLRHIVRHHTHDYSHRCERCGKGFIRPGCLQQHVNKNACAR